MHIQLWEPILKNRASNIAASGTPPYTSSEWPEKWRFRHMSYQLIMDIEEHELSSGPIRYGFGVVAAKIWPVEVGTTRHVCSHVTSTTLMAAVEGSLERLSRVLFNVSWLA
jgi:hypothetical protein